MKKIMFITMMIFFLIGNVSASVEGNIESVKRTANQHITTYSDYYLYVVTDSNKYAFDNGNITAKTDYEKGGLLNKDEYDISLSAQKETYLNDGQKYWTMTESSSGFNYFVGDFTDLESGTSETLSGARPTAYIQEDTQVTGRGTFDDPWMFTLKSSVNTITIVDNETSSKKMADKKYDVNYGENKQINIDLPAGRKMDTSDKVVECDNGLSYTFVVTSTGIRLDLKKVKRASKCILSTTDIKYNVTVTSTNSAQGTVFPKKEEQIIETQTIQVVHNEGQGYVITPAAGYKYLSNTCGGEMTAADSFMNITNITADKTCTVSFERSIINITFEPNGGNCSVSSMEMKPGEAYGTLPTPTRTGYIFNGWFTAASGGTKVTASTVVPKSQGSHTLYAQWTITSYSYTVRHYLMNTSGSYPSDSYPTYSQTFSANYGTVLTLSNLRNTSSTYNVSGGISYSYGTANGINNTQYTITSGNVIIRLYYVRSRYYVSASLGSGMSSVSGANAYYYYGQAVSLYAYPSSYYKFSYYNYNGGTYYNRSLSFTMGTSAVTVYAYASMCSPQYSCSIGYLSGSQCYYSASQGAQSCACITAGGRVITSDTGYYYTLGYPQCGYHACPYSCSCDTSGVSYLGVAYRSNGSPYYKSWVEKYVGWSWSNESNSHWYQWQYQNGSTSYMDPNYCYGTVDWSTCSSSLTCPYGGYVSGYNCYMNADYGTPTSC